MRDEERLTPLPLSRKDEGEASESARVPPVQKPPAGRQRICSEQQVKLIDPIWVVGPVPRGAFGTTKRIAATISFGSPTSSVSDTWRIGIECTDAQFYENQGESLLKRHGWSRVEVIKAYFPQYEWYEWLFVTTPRGFWHKLENRKRYYAWLGREARFSAAGRLVAADLRRLVEQLCDHALQHPALAGRRAARSVVRRWSGSGSVARR